MRDAVLDQRPVVDQLPQAAASRCFRILASRIAGSAPGGGAGLRVAARTVTPVERRSAAAPEELFVEESTRCA